MHWWGEPPETKGFPPGALGIDVIELPDRFEIVYRSQNLCVIESVKWRRITLLTIPMGTPERDHPPVPAIP